MHGLGDGVQLVVVQVLVQQAARVVRAQRRLRQQRVRQQRRAVRVLRGLALAPRVLRHVAQQSRLRQVQR